MSILAVAAGCLGTIFLSALFSGMETAAYAVSRVRLRYLARHGNVRAGQMLGLLKRLQLMVMVTLIGNNVVVFLGTHMLQSRLAAAHIEGAEFWATFILTPILFVFAETMPKHIAYMLSEGFCLRCVRLMRGASILFRPVSLVLGLVSSGLTWLVRRANLTAIEPSRRESILAHIEMGAHEGRLSRHQHRMASHIMAIERKPVRQIMTPFQSLVGAARGTPLDEVIQLMRRTGFRRIPILDRKQHVVHGIVTVTALIGRPIDGREPAASQMETPVTLAAGETVGTALARLQEAHLKAGIVMENGRALGLVTVNDLVAEAIGMDKRD